MKRSVITCDICGEEVSLSGYFTTRRWRYICLVGDKPYHVCYSCKEAFEKWLKEREEE